MRILKEIFKRPVTILFLTIIMIGLGIFSLTGMSINLLPNIGFPYLSIQAIYTGADAETVDSKVTSVLEENLKNISGVRELSTYSIDNASIVVLQFEYGTNLEDKKAEVSDCLGNITLPSDCNSPTITDIDLNSTSMFTLTLYSETEDMSYVSSKADTLSKKLSSISGVEKVTMTGAPETKVKVETIHGLESLAALIAKELINDASYDIPLGEIASGTGPISISNSSSAKTIDEVRDLTIGITVSESYLATFQSIQNTIKNIEDMNSEDCEKLYEDAKDMNRFMDELDSKPTAELEDFYDDVSFMKALISLIENYSAATLKMMWNTTLKPIVEDDDFKNLSDEELHDLANDTDISYDLLKWLQDNSDTNPDTGKTYAEEKWNIIVLFRQNHPDEVLDSDYPELFYDLGIYSSDPSSPDYKSSDDIEDEVAACRIVSLVGLRNYIDKRTNNEEITNSDYALLFATSSNDYAIPITATTIKIIRSPNFDSNYQIFYQYKLTHQHEEDLYDEATDTHTTVMKGDPISSADFMLLYNQMVFEDEFDIPPTERLIDFIRDVDFTSTSVKFLVSQACDVYLSTDYETKAYYNKKEAIEIDLYASSDSNSTSIAKEAQAIIEAFNQEETKAHAVMLNNQADFISDSLSNALVSLLIGMVLAVLVIYLFLRKVKSSLIIAVSMPLSVLCTLACLYAMGITLNMVSVGGLAVGIGMLVDNSIVVLESISSERSKGKDVYQASIDGVKLVLGSLIGSTLTSICVFFPILCINGLTKEIFADLSWAVIFSLTFSLVVAVLVIPTLFCLFYKKEDISKTKEKKNSIFSKITDKYSILLERCLRHKGIVILSSLALFALSFLLLLCCKIEFLPSIDQQKIEVTLPFASGDDEKYCQNKTYQVYELLSEKVSDMEYISMSVGYSGMIQTNISGTVAIQLNANAKNTTTIVEEIRNIIEESSYDRDYSVTSIDGVVASLVGGMSGVSVQVYGDDVEVLKEIASKTEKDVLTKNGIRRASDNMLSKAKSYTISFDKDKLVNEGLDYTTVVSTLRVGLAGYEISQIEVSDKDYDLSVSFKEDTVEYYGSLEKIVIGVNSDNEMVKLGDVSTIKEFLGRPIIRKVNDKNVLSISVESFGIDTNTASKYLQESINQVLQDYPSYTYQSSGVSSYLSDAFQGLIIALVVSFFLLFGVMACLFESLKKPCIIIFSFPFAFVGGFIAMAISQVGLNVVSFIGLIMLMGVIINDAIVLNERIDQLVEEGYPPRVAVIEGCRERIRAVLMTTLTTVLALIPMALGIGKGSELMQPLGVVAIGGMTIGTCVTLILIPSVYCLFYKIKFNKNETIYTGKDYLLNEEDAISKEEEKPIEETKEEGI